MFCKCQLQLTTIPSQSVCDLNFKSVRWTVFGESQISATLVFFLFVCLFLKNAGEIIQKWQQKQKLAA